MRIRNFLIRISVLVRTSRMSERVNRMGKQY